MSTPQQESDFNQLKQEVLTLALKPSKNFHALACTLWKAHSLDREIIIEVERAANIKRRALYYLLNVGELLSSYEIAASTAEQIGWTKLQIIARHLQNCPTKPSQRDFEHALSLSTQTTANALPAALRGNSRALEPATRSILMRLSVEQYSVVEEALLGCGAIKRGKGLISKEDALTRLAHHYIDSTSKNKKSRL